MIDPVCLIHGKKMSEHNCLYCCLCFKSLTFDECNVLPDGSREDVCKQCAAQERQHGKQTREPESEAKDDGGGGNAE